jgi:hypothetical protein
MFSFAAKIIAATCLLSHLSEARSKKIVTHDAELTSKLAAKGSKVVSKDILNHSDLQVMISVYVGSNQE